MTRFIPKLRRRRAASALPASARPRGDVRLLVAGAISAVLALGVAACGGSSGDGSGGSIDLVAYSTPEEAYTQDLEPGFNATSDGDGVEFSNSFGSSGDQSRAVEAGQPAGVVHFSLEPDMTRLVDAGLVAEDWNQNEYKGIVEDSVVVFVTRAGNPKDIQSWDDLLRDDVEVLTPNPFTSGGARWNLMAAYGNQTLTEGNSAQDGLNYLADLLANVPVQDESARDSLATFTGGKGDVLLAYENEAIAAQEAGEDVDYVVPDNTILIETPIAVTTDADDSAQDVRRLRVHRRGAAAVGRQWLPAGGQVRVRAERRQVPGPARPVHDRRSRRLGPGDRPISSIRRTDRSPRSRRIWGSPRSEPEAEQRSSGFGRRRAMTSGQGAVATRKHRRGRASGSASAAPR